MQSPLVVLVTGANKGIGFQTVKELVSRSCRAYLTARNPKAGQAAAEELGAKFLALDVSDDQSIEKAAADFGRTEQQLDVLINNAAIYVDENTDITRISRHDLEETFATNTIGAIRVTQQFLPYLRRAKSARIVNVSSGYGEIDGLSAAVPSYCLSKLALNGATIMLSAQLQAEKIAVNAVCPGWVRTDMGGANATRSVEKGAETIVWLATEAPAAVTGKFFRDCREINW